MGRIEQFEIRIPFLKKDRIVRVYLPESYDCEPEKRFPVLYMQDGQNLYDNSIAFGGQSWEVKKTMEELEVTGRTDGIIVVGIDNEGERRFSDYSPWENDETTNTFLPDHIGGDGEKYAEFFVEVLKKYVDTYYRTKPDYENTAVAGSSMGGYISTYIMAKYPNVFSKVGAFSTASWFNEEPFLEYIKKGKSLSKHKCFLSVGTNETSRPTDPMCQIYVNNTLNLQKALLNQGVEPENLELLVNVGETHCEISWSLHFKQFIEFIF